MKSMSQEVQVLLVEDSRGDARLVAEAFRDARFSVRLNIVRDGREALEFLNREGAHAGAARPDLVILDLHLPKADGFEVLSGIKADRELKQIPVVVLTGSVTDETIQRCYDLNANCFVAKRSEWAEFTAAVRLIQDFWCGLVALPPRFQEHNGAGSAI